MKDVKKGVKEFGTIYIKNLEDADGNSTPESAQMKEGKLLNAGIKCREQARLLGSLDSHDETESSSIVQTERRETECRHMQACNKSELDRWYHYGPLQKIKNTLLFWIEMSPDLNNPFPGLARLALDIYSIPTMTAECERVFSETKLVINHRQ